MNINDLGHIIPDNNKLCVRKCDGLCLTRDLFYLTLMSDLTFSEYVIYFFYFSQYKSLFFLKLFEAYKVLKFILFSHFYGSF